MPSVNGNSGEVALRDSPVLVDEPVQVGRRHQIDQVLVPLLVLAQQHQVVIAVRILARVICKQAIPQAPRVTATCAARSRRAWQSPPGTGEQRSPMPRSGAGS